MLRVTWQLNCNTLSRSFLSVYRFWSLDENECNHYNECLCLKSELMIRRQCLANIQKEEQHLKGSQLRETECNIWGHYGWDVAPLYTE